MKSINNVVVIFTCIIVSIIADRLTCRIIQHVSKRKADTPMAQRRQKIWNLVTEALAKPLHWFYLTVGCSLGLLIIDKPEWAASIWSFLMLGMKAISIWCVIWFLLNITESVTKIMNERAKATESKLDDMLVPIASSAVKFLLFAMGILVILQNMGYSVTALIGGLGIGAGVVALASKDTIANMFGALVVFFDKPFEIGDWVEINGVEGAVEEIRLRVTLIRTFDGTLVTIPNSALSNTNINNWQVRQYRKMECGFGLLYSTRSDQIRKIVDDIKTHIKNHPETFGPEFYVNFDGFGDSSFDIRVEAFTINKGRSKHLADKQEFMLEIVRIVEEAGTGFAFPTRTLDMPVNPIRIKMDRD